MVFDVIDDVDQWRRLLVNAAAVGGFQCSGFSIWSHISVHRFL